MNDSGLPFILTVIIGIAIIAMASLFAIYTSPSQKEGAAISVIEKSAPGYVLMWENGMGPTPIMSNDRMRTIAAGARHACTITTTGRLLCWGNGENGQLGHADTRSNTGLAGEVQGGGNWQAVTSGSNHSCGIMTDGMSLCWGDGAFGQLGNGDYAERRIPSPLDTGEFFIALSAGDRHSCGINMAGLAFCWGDNSHGQLGDGGQTPSSRPQPIAGDLRFIDISAGYDHTCALSIDGTVWCWGRGEDGQIGDGSQEDNPLPTSVRTNMTFQSVATGDGYACGLNSGGEIWCWGSKAEGGKAVPFRIEGGPFQQVVAGKTHACALRTGGIWCFRMGNENKGLMAGKDFAHAIHITPVDRFQAISTRADLLLATVK